MRDQDPLFARWDRKLNSWILSVKKLPVLIWLTTNHWADIRFCARKYPHPPSISPILSLCKYGPASEEVGQGSDDWRLGTIFPRYFLPLGKKIFPWWNSLITDRGGGRRTPALLWTKLCSLPPNLGIFAPRTCTLCKAMHSLHSCALACLHIGQNLTFWKNELNQFCKLSSKIY